MWHPDDYISPSVETSQSTIVSNPLLEATTVALLCRQRNLAIDWASLSRRWTSLGQWGI